ncbi:hypothetical protein D3C78_817570 [compost metagenome]
MCQFRCTDQNAETAVLEEGRAVIDQRRQRIANALRHDDETHGRDIAMPERTCGLHLAGIDRTNAGAQILAEICSLTKTETDNGEDRFGIMARKPAGQSARQQREHAEIPQHQLHQRRHVAVIGHIGRHQRITEAERRQADGKQHDGERHGKQP